MLLYYISDRTRFSAVHGQAEAVRSRLLQTVRAAAGVDFIQLREKDLPVRELETLAREVVAVIREQEGKARLLINSRLDVAIAAAAHGVHLRSGNHDLDPSTARAVMANAGVANPLIAVSCHSVKEVALAQSSGSNFVVFGPVFEKDGATNSTGLDLLSAACRAANGMPVLALGGITRSNAPQCLAAGASGVAGIRLFQEGNAVETIAKLSEIA